MNKRYDVFISHASEDKDNFVRPLALKLKRYGVKVWYDEFSLQLGSSLSRSIDTGLLNSRYGIIILSKFFFNKDWPEYEIKSLNAIELGQKNKIIPIWKDVTRNKVLKFSPYLADKLAIVSKNYSLEQIAIKLIESIRPDLFENHNIKKTWKKMIDSTMVTKVNFADIRPSPIRYRTLPKELIYRVKLIRASLLSCIPETLEYWIDGFKRDLHPEEEILIWERICSVYLEYIQSHDINPSLYTGILRTIVMHVNGWEKQINVRKLNLDKKLEKDIIRMVKAKNN